MPDITVSSRDLALLAAHHGGGPGALLRTIILVGLIGSALLAWFLLRGYGGQD